MTFTWKNLFFLFAFICFLLATFGVPGPKGGWVPLGLALLTLALWVP